MCAPISINKDIMDLARGIALSYIGSSSTGPSELNLGIGMSRRTELEVALTNSGRLIQRRVGRSIGYH
jgi:hypothetical protein